MTKSIMLAAGGTGGHLFPAFSLAEEMKRRGYEVDLISDTRTENIDADFPVREVYQVPSATLKGKDPLSALNTIFKLGRGTKKARSIMKKVKPLCIVGFGGYPTFPPLIAARTLGIPSILHEQNAVMGRANRMLSKRVTAIALSFEQTKYIDEGLADKAYHTGNPVRDVVIEHSAEPYPVIGDDEPFHLLVFGGSQGAQYFSDVVPPALDLLGDDLKQRLRVVQQCRKEDIERVEKAYDQAGISATLSTFFADLPKIMANAHLIIARSGASTVTELAVMGRPSFLVPFPFSLDNDQLKNARFIEELGGAWCAEQKDIDEESLAGGIENLMRDPALLQSAAAKVKEVGMPDAVSRLADLVEDVANR